jgi:tetratricopeptide (TPR) repeat protein
VIKTAIVANAFRKRQYDKVARLMPDAVLWTTFAYPLSYFQLLQCQLIELQLLMLEGRASELEIVTRFLWAAIEPDASPNSIPKNPIIVNNLALAWMLQTKYAEAAKLFSAKLVNGQSKHRLLLLNNLAFCQVQDEQLEAAETTLSEAFKLLGSSQAHVSSARLRLIRALVLCLRNDWAGAESSLEEAAAIGSQQKLPLEFDGACAATLARVRYRQGRLDESDLLYRNAIDIFSSANNPNYIALAQYLHQYAQVQKALGQAEQARQSLERARCCYESYVERETATVAGIKTRLIEPKKLRTASDLLTVSLREPLLEMRD